MEIETFCGRAGIFICALMRSNALSPSFGFFFFPSGGRDPPPPTSFAYRPAICKQGIMASASRPYLRLIQQHAAVWPGGDNGSVVASFKACVFICPSVYPPVRPACSRALLLKQMVFSVRRWDGQRPAPSWQHS